MRNSIFLVPIIFLLAACGTTDPVIQTVIQRVEVPIEVPCRVELPPVPSFNFNNLREDDTLFDKVRALLADRRLHLAYEKELLAALNACR